MNIVFDKETCHNLAIALEKEWLETNGIGGYASSTITGTNTRRYHGLLMSATRPPLGRVLMLSKLEETLFFDTAEYALSTNIYPNTVYPEGYKNQVRFSLAPFPVFYYHFNGVEITKTVFMIYGKNTTVITYQINTRNETINSSFLRIRFLIAFRDYHSLTHENSDINTRYTRLHNGICLQPYKPLPPMYIFSNTTKQDRTSFWYKNMEYSKETERGMEAHEDHYSPFALEFCLNKDAFCYIVATTDPYESTDVAKLMNSEIARRNSLKTKSLSFSFPLIKNTGDVAERLIDRLLYTADSFLVKREGDTRSIIAGYHWFGDWGRDTMISLPGITLVTGRFREAKDILFSYARFVDKGMIPNRFPDNSELPEYNTVDASLWYIYAVYQYFLYTKDIETIKKGFFPVLDEIIQYYQRGTRYNIQMDSDGLISAGEEGVQLTWMDAKAGDWVVTPRSGKAVEINALWYNALMTMSFFSDKLNLEQESIRYKTLGEQVNKSFDKAFWNQKGSYLYDYIDNETKNSSIRPNQLFAVSLPYTMLSLQRQAAVLDVVKKHLLTPYGLRSLSPYDKEYIGRYAGDIYKRDGAYHQGTVWAWLIGPYISAYMRVNGNNGSTRRTICENFNPFFRHLSDAGLGTISEIFDGDPPHTPRGCISQAWSVAEILRTYLEGFLR